MGAENLVAEVIHLLADRWAQPAKNFACPLVRYALHAA